MTKESRLYLAYHENRTGGEICEGQENESWPSHESSHTEVIFERLCRNQPCDRMFYDSFEVDPALIPHSELFLAVVRYSSGDTFGNSEGNWHTAGVFKTRKEAAKHLEHITSDKYTGCKPWEGYFESLEGTTVERLQIEDD